MCSTYLLNYFFIFNLIMEVYRVVPIASPIHHYSSNVKLYLDLTLCYQQFQSNNLSFKSYAKHCAQIFVLSTSIFFSEKLTSFLNHRSPARMYLCGLVVFSLHIICSICVDISKKKIRSTGQLLNKILGLTLNYSSLYFYLYPINKLISFIFLHNSLVLDCINSNC